MWWMLAGAAIGAAAGAISTRRRERQEKEALEHQQELARAQYLLGKNYSDTQFGIQKNQALDELGVQRRNLDTNLGLSINEFNTGLLGQAYGVQDARIQNESSIGMSLAAEGASGTRGNEANELVRAYAAQGLDRSIELQDRQNSDYLNRMMTGANMTSDAIERERASWMPGGYRVQMKDAQDAYNRSIADLGQSDFDWRLDSLNDPRQIVLDYTAGTFGGASSGMSMGRGVDNYFDARNTNRNPWENLWG